MQEVESIETWICEDLDEMNIVDAMDRSGKQNTKVCWKRRGGMLGFKHPTGLHVHRHDAGAFGVETRRREGLCERRAGPVQDALALQSIALS